MPLSKTFAGLTLVLAAAALTGCTVTVSSPYAEPSATPSSSPAEKPAKSTKTKTKTDDAPAITPVSETTHKSTPKGPRIVSFKVVQKPRCAEGTDVFHTEAVPLIIKWKVTGAHSAALSVDDPTGTPGTYGPVALHGTQEFTFSCSGAVGSTETHTYALYTVGGGKQKHKTLKVSAKVRETGVPVT